VVTVVVVVVTVVMVVVTVVLLTGTVRERSDLAGIARERSDVTIVTAAVHHVPTTGTVAAAALTAGVGIAGGERRNGNNDRCGESKKCSALEHV